MSHSTEHFATPVAEVDAAAPDDGLVDETAPDEVDSAYGPSVQGSETTSLDPFTKEYRKEYGRTYHSYGSTEHWGPNDEKAQKQQDLSHHVWTLALKNELFLAPVKEPKNILDVGTGTGMMWLGDDSRCPTFDIDYVADRATLTEDREHLQAYG